MTIRACVQYIPDLVQFSHHIFPALSMGGAVEASNIAGVAQTKPTPQHWNGITTWFLNATTCQLGEEFQVGSVELLSTTWGSSVNVHSNEITFYRYLYHFRFYTNNIEVKLS